MTGLQLLLARYRDTEAEARGIARRPALTVAAGVLLGALLIMWAAYRGIVHWQSIPSTWDAVWHANTVRFILDTGQASSTHMGELRNVETHQPLYYPSVFHALTAVFCQLTGAAPTTGYTVTRWRRRSGCFRPARRCSPGICFGPARRTPPGRRPPRPRCRRRSPRCPTSSSVQPRCPTWRPTASRSRRSSWSSRRCGTGTASLWPCWHWWASSRCTSPAGSWSSCSWRPGGFWRVGGIRCGGAEPTC